jgi:hypothetical protein
MVGYNFRDFIKKNNFTTYERLVRFFQKEKARKKNFFHEFEIEHNGKSRFVETWTAIEKDRVINYTTGYRDPAEYEKPGGQLKSFPQRNRVRWLKTG